MGRFPIVTFRARAVALLLAAGAAILLSCASWRAAKTVEPPSALPPSSANSTDRAAAAIEAPPPPAAGGPPETAAPAAGTDAVGQAAAPSTPPASQAPAGTAEKPVEPPLAPAAPPPAVDNGRSTPAPGGAPPAGESVSSPALPPAGEEAGDATAAPAPGRNGVAKGGGTRPGHVTVARLPENLSFDHDGPYWTRGREELVYRVEFLGITMGYARFVFNGKVLLNGREVYHLSVRAWTSNILSLIYPINDTIDYYMDVKTLMPLRQEYTSGNRKKDDVAIYDQETGKIVYRYKESGEIRKEVDAVPNVYDPVTLTYFIRSRDLGAGEKGMNVYAGRKVWEISAVPLGVEKIATDRGEVETVVIRPVIKRDGKVENKGDLRMWMTRDERKVPIRLYAKFKKIRMWTLVGELMPERKGG